MAEWFYQSMGSEAGPISSAELKQKAAAGVITPDTLIRQGKSGAWVAAVKANGLFKPPADAFDNIVAESISTPRPYVPEPYNPPPVERPKRERMEVVIVDVDVPVSSLVRFMFRWSGAAFLVFLIWLPVAFIVAAGWAFFSEMLH